MSVCTVSFAAPKKATQKNLGYDIEAIITLDGIKTKKKFRLFDGKTAEIKQSLHDHFTQVTIHKSVLDGKPAMQMEFIIGREDAIGNKEIIATPRILANLGEKSSIILGDKKLIVSATATKAVR